MNYFENDYVWNYLHYNDLIIFSILHRVSTLCKPTLIPVQENFSRLARASSSQIYLATKKFLCVVGKKISCHNQVIFCKSWNKVIMNENFGLQY